MVIEMHKNYKTGSGKPVRIISVDFNGTYPEHNVVGLVEHEPGVESICIYRFDGRVSDGVDIDNDLVEVQPWDDIEIDAPVMACIDGVGWYRAHFAGVREGRPCVWDGGRTSWMTASFHSVGTCRKPTPTEITENKFQ